MVSQLRDVYDLLVVGGGPAGAAAALRAAQRDARTLLIDKQPSPRTGADIEWLGPAGLKLCQECGLSLKKAGATEFRDLRLLSWDLRRSAAVSERDLRGWLVERAAFEEALLREAQRAGAETLRGLEVCDIRLGEQHALLRLSDRREVIGQVVVIADGAASPVGRRANLVVAAQQPTVAQAAYAQCQTTAPAVGIDVALGASRAGQVATIVRRGTAVGVRLIARTPEQPIDRLFGSFCAGAARCGLLPEEIARQPVRYLCPAGVALDMDTHVGKRCLLVGDAGGFVAAFSGEGIYPAMQSGWIAAETALRALRAPLLQDELATFGVAWRQRLADYLRMPNTDLSLLVPLVFGNQQMSRRVARAFLLGQPF